MASKSIKPAARQSRRIHPAPAQPEPVQRRSKASRAKRARSHVDHEPHGAQVPDGPTSENDAADNLVDERDDMAAVVPANPGQRDNIADLITRLEVSLDGPLLVYWTPADAQITIEDAQALRRVLAGKPRSGTLHLCLTSQGGQGQAALPIVRELRQHCDRLVVQVPVRASSAATMVALGADEIRLGTCAYLTPVDAALQHQLAPKIAGDQTATVIPDEVARVLALWRKENGHGTEHPFQHLFPHVHPLVIGAIERLTSLSQRICDTLLAFHLAEAEHRKRIVAALVDGYPAHSYPILLEEAQRIGLPAVAMEPAVETALVEVVELLQGDVRQRRWDWDEGRLLLRRRMTVIQTRDRRAEYREDGLYRDENEENEDEDEERLIEIRTDRGWTLIDATGEGDLHIEP